jgi:hypothetical protein
MPYQPTNISGPIVLRTNSTYSTANFPGFTYDPNLPLTPANTLYASGINNELIARSYAGANQSGVTADYIAQLFFRNDVTAFPLLPLYSGFVPNYYLTTNKEIGLSFKEAQGSVTLPAGPGSANDRYEVIQFIYSNDVFLKSLAGATGVAMTGFTYSHSIYAGNTTINANHIFYRKLGRVTA